MTAKQKAILGYIRTCTQENGLPPMFSQIMQTFNFAATTSVTRHLEALERRGMLMRTYKARRGIKVTKAGKRALGEYPEMLGTFAYFLYDEAVRCMKLLECKAV